MTSRRMIDDDKQSASDCVYEIPDNALNEEFLGFRRGDPEGQQEQSVLERLAWIEDLGDGWFVSCKTNQIENFSFDIKTAAISWWVGFKHQQYDKPTNFSWFKNQEDTPLDCFLQRAYHDKYQDCTPRLSVPTSSQKPHLAGSHSIGIQLQEFSADLLNWPTQLFQFLPNYFVDEEKFSFLVEKIENYRTVRIFLSSPFDGCEKEREYFMKNAVPALSAMCLKKRIFLSVVEMRWGITEDMGNQNQTVMACLRSLDRSDIFIGYFGARYGSSNLVTLPSVPGGLTWIGLAVEVCASSIYPYLVAYKNKSITEMEFQHAFLHEENYKDPSKPVSFFFYRSESYDSELRDKAIAANDAREEKNYSIENAASADAAAELKAAVISKCFDPKAPSPSPAYGAVFDAYQTPQVGADLMFACCEAVISRALALVSDHHSVSRAYEMHSTYARLKLELHVDFDDAANRRVQDFLSSTTSQKPIIITGASGAGKSCFLASLVCVAPLPPHFQSTFHFVGCNAESLLLADLVCRQYEEFVAIVTPLLPMDVTIPSGDDLSVDEMWPAMVRLYSDDTLAHILPSILFVVDGLNQMTDEAYEIDSTAKPSDFRWFPEVVPSKFKVIFSCFSGPLMDGLCSRCKLQPTRTAAGVGSGAPGSVSSGRDIITLSPLAVDQRRILVERWHEKFSKVVDETIFRPLWMADQSSNPLYLSLALNYLVLHGSFNYFKKVGCSELLAAKSVPELLQSMLKMLAEASRVRGREGTAIVQDVFRFVYCSFQGLSADDIIGLCCSEQQRNRKGESDTAIDKADWVQLEHSLSQFLVPRGGLFGFSHDFVRQAIEAIYFGNDRTLVALEELAVNGDEDAKKALDEAHVKIRTTHSLMATFFQLKAYNSSGSGSGSGSGGEAASLYRSATQAATFHQRQAGIRPSVVVAVRVRPMDSRELALSSGSEPCVIVKDKRVFLIDPISKEPKVFDFNLAFNSNARPKSKKHASQKTIHRNCGEDIVAELLEGFNVTVLAYGQTSSGKSHTMFGSRSEPGLIPRILLQLLQQLQQRAMKMGWTWTTKCTMVEVYQNKIYDLLHGSGLGAPPVSASARHARTSPSPSPATKAAGRGQAAVTRDRAPAGAAAAGAKPHPPNSKTHANSPSHPALTKPVATVRSSLAPPTAKASPARSGKTSRSEVKIVVKSPDDGLAAAGGAATTASTSTSEPPLDINDFKALAALVASQSTASAAATCGTGSAAAAGASGSGGIGGSGGAAAASAGVAATVGAAAAAVGGAAVGRGVAAVGTHVATSDGDLRKKTAAMETVLSGAVEVEVTSYPDLDRVLQIGSQVRTTKATTMNDASSRSHCILTLTLRQKHSKTKEVKVSKLHFVDLAGSERARKSGYGHMQETAAINSSLSVLNRCIRALSNPSATYVPYRDSTLTWFLQDSLGGTAKTVFIATVSPAADNFNETLQTLQYATFAARLAVTKDDMKLLEDERRKRRLVEEQEEEKRKRDEEQLAQPASDLSNEEIIVECIEEGSRLRVRVVSPGYDPEKNCQFPRNMRDVGRRYRVEGLLPVGGYYAVKGKITPL